MLNAVFLLGMHERLVQEASVSVAYIMGPVVCAGKVCYLSLCMAITWLTVIHMPYCFVYAAHAGVREAGAPGEDHP